MASQAEVSRTLKQNADRIEERIRSACSRADRDRYTVQVIPISKYVDADVIEAMIELGYRCFGESRPQALWEKAAQLDQVDWHLVGHLQRNKINRTLPLVKLIHSVDSRRLLTAIDEEASRIGKVQEVLLELHLTEEESKSGFPEAEWNVLPEHAIGLSHVRIVGLMGMAALDADEPQAKASFARLRQIRDQLQLPPPHHLKHLSMGMTHDFEEAILEGATMVRIGSAFFEGLPGETC